jgi:hypothetical protein
MKLSKALTNAGKKPRPPIQQRLDRIFDKLNGESLFSQGTNSQAVPTAQGMDLIEDLLHPFLVRLEEGTLLPLPQKAMDGDGLKASAFALAMACRCLNKRGQSEDLVAAKILRCLKTNLDFTDPLKSEMFEGIRTEAGAGAALLLEFLANRTSPKVAAKFQEFESIARDWTKSSEEERAGKLAKAQQAMPEVIEALKAECTGQEVVVKILGSIFKPPGTHTVVRIIPCAVRT